eukprot:393955-Amphidinium_carterae.1
MSCRGAECAKLAWNIGQQDRTSGVHGNLPCSNSLVCIRRRIFLEASDEGLMGRMRLGCYHGRTVSNRGPSCLCGRPEVLQAWSRVRE